MGNFLFSAQGRISRKTFWLNWLLPYFAASFAAAILDAAMFPINPATQETTPVFQGILGLLLIWPSIAINTKRLHDRGMTGWWQLAPSLLLLPLAAYWYYTNKVLAGGANTRANLAVVDPIVIAVAMLIAFATLLYPAINMMFLRGQSGPNKYGDDPLGVNLKDTFA